ncbi:MAG: nuclear transport factor 2 family protein [Lacunisphaera sp.]
MKTTEIATRLVALCREAKWEAAQKELFAEDATSIEPQASEGFSKETKGLGAIIEKGNKFGAMIEQLHSLTVSEPLVVNNAIACTMNLDVTMRGKGRMQMSEICLYHVKDGKIFSEQFFV